MIARFMTVLSVFLLIFSMIGCGDSSSIVKPEAQPAVSPVVFEDALISENIRATPVVSVDTVAQPLPLKQEKVAAAPPLLALIPAVVPVISCGVAVFDVGTLFFGTPQFLSNRHMFFVGAAGMACPDGAILKGIKGIKILKSAKTLKNIEFKNFTRSRAAFRENFERLIGRPVNPGYEVHHSIPWKNKADAEKFGININQPWHGIEITKGYHRSITDQYGKDWDTFFKRLDLTQFDVLLYQQHMIKKYRLKPGSYLELELIK